MGISLPRAMRGSLMALASLIAFQAFAADTVIQNVRIELGDGTVIEKGSVVISGERIIDVGATVSAPQGASVLDGTGLTAYPGFIDAYSTRGLRLPDPPAAGTPPANTTTAPPTMWEGNRRSIRASLKASDLLNLGSTAEDARKNGVIAAFLCPGSGILRGSGALALMTDEKQTPPPFGTEISFRGAGGGGPGGGGGGQGASPYPGSLLGYIALLRQTLYDAQAYKAAKPEKADPDLEELAKVFGGTAVIAADTVPDITRALRLAQEFGLNPILTGGREAYKMIPELGSNVPVIVSVSIGNEPTVNPSPDGPPAEVLEERRAVWRERATNAKQLIEAGVKVAFSSDGDGVGSYLANVRKLIAGGLSREAALKAMTATPAQLFGMAEWGAIRKGSSANLVVMDGDFASEKTAVKFVFVNGKKFEVSK